MICNYSNLTPDELLKGDDVLAVISFDDCCKPTGQARHFSTGLPVLSEPLCEVWYSQSEVEYGINRSCYWSADGELIFLGLWIDENHCPDLRTAIFDAYVTLLQTLMDRNYPYLVRVWNYLPKINHGEDDNERYKQFCLGRHEAFNHYQQHRYPAATAIGHSGGNIVIYLIASRQPTLRHFENPCQLSAYHYPREYGPKSPSFARASMWRQNHGSRQLYISGTASIRGHRSQHPWNFHDQVEVACENIDILLQHITREIPLGATPSLDLVKVYLRNPRDLDAAKNAIECHFGSKVPTLFLKGDICRRELLVEIDGFCQL